MDRLPTDENGRAMVISCLIDEVRRRIEASNMPDKAAVTGILKLLSDIVFEVDEEVSAESVRELLPVIKAGLNHHLELLTRSSGDNDTAVQVRNYSAAISTLSRFAN